MAARRFKSNRRRRRLKKWAWRSSRSAERDAAQRGDPLFIIFARMPASEHIRLAQQKGIKIVIAELLTAQGSRSNSQLRRQKFISRMVERLAPRSFISAFNWDAYRLADAILANTPWEAHLMHYLFDAPKGTPPRRPQRRGGNFFELVAIRTGAMARLHHHPYGTQTCFGTGTGRHRGANTGVDYRPGLCGNRSLCPAVFRPGKKTSRRHPLRRGHHRPRAARTSLPGGARVCVVKRHGDPQPVRRGGRRLRMSASIERSALGARARLPVTPPIVR